MPRAFGGQSQQRWGDNTLNRQESMRDVQMIDTSGKVCATGDARRKGMLVLAYFRLSDPATPALLDHLQKLADAYKESGKLTVWAVSEDDSESTVAFAKEAGVTIPILLDRDGYHAMTYGITTFPTLYFADAAGTIQRKIVGVSESGMRDVSAKYATFAAVDAIDIFAPLPVPEAAPVLVAA